MTINDRIMNQILGEFNRSPARVPQAHFQAVLETQYNHMEFTGERLVINDQVKELHTKVFQEHVMRYDFASRFVKDKLVLDAACGAGYGVKMFEIAGVRQVTGVDVSEESIRYASAHYLGPNTRFLTADILSLPFDNETFDLVTSFETIEHIRSGADWIRESARVLKDGGLLIISTPNRSLHSPGLYFSEKPRHTYHLFEYNLSEFVGELLTEYDIAELYGQTFVHDFEQAAIHPIRESLGYSKDAPHYPEFVSELKNLYHLEPLSRIKNAQPTFVIAVCRKKSI